MKFKDGKTFSTYVRSKLHSSYITLATKQTLLSVKLVNHAMLRLVSDYQFIGPEGHTLDTPKEP